MTLTLQSVVFLIFTVTCHLATAIPAASPPTKKLTLVTKNPSSNGGEGGDFIQARAFLPKRWAFPKEYSANDEFFRQNLDSGTNLPIISTPDASGNVHQSVYLRLEGPLKRVTYELWTDVNGEGVQVEVSGSTVDVITLWTRGASGSSWVRYDAGEISRMSDLIQVNPDLRERILCAQARHCLGERDLAWHVCSEFEARSQACISPCCYHGVLSSAALLIASRRGCETKAGLGLRRSDTCQL